MSNREFLEKRRNRAIASILSFKDAYCDDHLPENISSALRSEILDQINGLCEVAFDLIQEDFVYNQLFLDRFNEMYDTVMADYDD